MSPMHPMTDEEIRREAEKAHALYKAHALRRAEAKKEEKS